MIIDSWSSPTEIFVEKMNKNHPYISTDNETMKFVAFWKICCLLWLIWEIRCLFIFLWFFTFLFFFIDFDGYYIVKLKRVNPDRNIFSINVELTSTFLLYRGLAHHHHRILKRWIHAPDRAELWSYPPPDAEYSYSAENLLLPNPTQSTHTFTFIKILGQKKT